MLKVTGHSFRKTLGDPVTDHTADLRVAADVLGHSDIQTTIKHYISRGKAHPEVATMVDNAVRGKRKAAKKSTKRRVINTDQIRNQARGNILWPGFFVAGTGFEPATSGL